MAKFWKDADQYIFIGLLGKIYPPQILIKIDPLIRNIIPKVTFLELVFPWKHTSFLYCTVDMWENKIRSFFRFKCYQTCWMCKKYQKGNGHGHVGGGKKGALHLPHVLYLNYIKIFELYSKLENYLPE